MKNVFLRSHDPVSEGAKALAKELEIKRIAHKHSRFTPRVAVTLINWGCSELPNGYEKCKLVNAPANVRIATNKLTAFDCLSKACRTVPHTTDTTKVKEWLADGGTVCARTLLRASGGDGLILFDGAQEFVKAPLWTQYIKKKDEYRIHVMRGEVISIQRKALRKDQDNDNDVDHRIRNLANGYIFARNDVSPPADVLNQSLLAVKAIGLDFGAVDVIWNEKKQQAFVLEINTAAGLEGTTVTDYANGFRKVIANG